MKNRYVKIAQQNLGKQVDLSFLKQTIPTLREQLTEVRSWEKQPTFYLTIACLGDAEALESDVIYCRERVMTASNTCV
jgi:hypothetical protein